MKSYSALLFLFLFLLPLSLKAQAKTSLDSTLYLIDNLTDNDTINFKIIEDKLSDLLGENIEQALQLSLVLKDKIEQLNNDTFLMHNNFYLSESYFLLGKIDSSKYFIDQAFLLAEELNDSAYLMNLYYTKGWINSEQDLKSIAQKAFFKGLKLAQKRNAFEEQMKFNNAIAYNYEDSEDLKKRLKYILKAKEIGDNNNLSHLKSYHSVLYTLAGVMQKINKTDSALIIYNQLKTIYKKDHYTTGLASIAHNISDIHKQNHNYDEAFNEAFKALAYDNGTGTIMYITNDYVTIAKIYNEIGNTDSAIWYYQKADSLSLASNLTKERLGITKNLAILYAQKNDHKSAYSALNLHIAARDSFNIIETEKQLQEIEQEYQSKEKEKENEVLRANMKKDKEIIQLQLLVIILMILALAFIIKQLMTNRERQQKINILNKILKNKNSELANGNASKDKFFSIIAHDLRGPISQMNELLKIHIKNKEKYTVEEAFKYLTLTQTELEKTYNLLEHLLTWSRSQLGKVNSNPQELNISAIINETLKPLSIIAKSKSVTIIKEVTENIKIFADKNMVSFIIRNLVVNAIKFTPEKGTIMIKETIENELLHLSIHDNGIGMSENQISKLFQIDEKINTKGTNNEPGTGLGLILCKEFADKNNIEIKIESTINKGSTFHLSFHTNGKIKR